MARSDSYRDLAQVAGGNLTRNVLRGLLKILVAGFLTPEAMGVLRSVYSFFRILASAADLGLDYAMVTFVSRAIREEDDDERKRLLRTVLVLKTGVAILLFVVGNLFAEQVARWVLTDASLTVYVRLVFLGVGGQLLWKYIFHLFSAHQQFGRVGLFAATMPTLMFGTAVVLALLGRLDLHASLLIYLLAPLVTILFWWPAVDRSLLRQRGALGATARRILRFSRWVYLTEIAYSVRSDVNPILLKNPALSGSIAAGELNAGLYSFGGDLANEISVVSQSLMTVLLPKAGSKSGPRELRDFIKKSYRLLGLLLVPLIGVMFLAEPGIRVLGWLKQSYLDYLPSVDAFMILWIGALFALASIPMRTLFYALEKPQVETRLGVVMVFVVLGGSLLLIPPYGYVGAAFAICIQRAIFFVCILTLGLRQLRALGRGSGLPGQADQ